SQGTQGRLAGSGVSTCLAKARPGASKDRSTPASLGAPLPLARDNRGQRSEAREQSAEVRGQRTERKGPIAPADGCPLSSDLCPLTDVRISRIRLSDWLHLEAHDGRVL